MNFIIPSLKKVFSTLKNNNELIDLLQDNKCLLTKEDLIEDYGDDSRKMDLKIYEYNVDILYSVAKVLLNNNDEIVADSVPLLEKNQVAHDEIVEALNMSGEVLDEKVIEQIYFTYKYCYVSSFFQNNIKSFLPSVDYAEMEDNEAFKYYLDALLKEFDKFDNIISDTSAFKEIENIPSDYVNYFSHLFGIEKGTFYMDDEKVPFFREIVKNIIEIYRIKGVNYCFEIFFGFLGINIEIEEFYFDRRYYYLKTDEKNPFTSYSSKTDFRTYMTTIDPSLNCSSAESDTKNILSRTEAIKKTDFTTQYNLNDFTDLAKKYGALAVLGYSKYDKNGNIYTDKVYKYFKTNYVRFTPTRDSSSVENFTIDEETAMEKYLTFLTPMYIYKEIKVEVYQENKEENLGWGLEGNWNGSDTDISFRMLDSESWDSVKKDNTDISYQDMVDEKYSDAFNNFLSKSYDTSSLYDYSQDSDDIGDTNYYTYSTDPKSGKTIRNSYISSIGETNTRRVSVGKKRTIISNANKNIGRLNNCVYLSFSRVRNYILSVDNEDVSFYDIPPTSNNNIWSYKFSSSNETDFDGFASNSIRTMMRDCVGGKEYTDVKSINISLENEDSINKLISSSYYGEYNSLSRSSDTLLSLVNTIEVSSDDFKEELESLNNTLKFSNWNINSDGDIIEKRIYSSKTSGETYISNGKLYCDGILDDEAQKILSLNCFVVTYLLNKSVYTVKIYKNKSNTNAYNPYNYILSPLSLSYSKSKTVDSYEIALNKFYLLTLNSSSDEPITRFCGDYTYKVNGTYYSPVVIGNSSLCKRVASLDKAEDYSGLNKEICINSGKLSSYDDVKDNGIYRWGYKNISIGDIYYSTVDNKFYRVSSYGKCGFKEIDIRGNLSILDDTVFSNDDLTINYAKLYKYDECWNGPSEENDNDDFILFNNSHKITWGIFDDLYTAGNIGDNLLEGTTSSGYPCLKRISKVSSDKIYDSVDSLGEDLLEEICKHSVENFSNYELISD